MKTETAIDRLSTIGPPRTTNGGHSYYADRDGWRASFINQGDRALCLRASYGDHDWHFMTMKQLVHFVLSRRPGFAEQRP